jgi:DNA ligase-1
MKRFSRLYQALDETTKTGEKLDALVHYLKDAPAEDAIWAIHFLMGRKPRQLVATPKLKQWAAESARIPSWLFDACYETVGDLAETITLVLPESDRSSDIPLHDWVEQRMLRLTEKAEDEKKQAVLKAWSCLDSLQRFVYNKLITGGFRVGVSQRLVTQALSRVSGIDAAAVAHRLMGNWDPTPGTYHSFLSRNLEDTDFSKPYPFFLAYPLDTHVHTLGLVSEWKAEWKWDGIRAQVVRRNHGVFIWSRGEELVTEKYPEIIRAASCLPEGTVLDGELLCWKNGMPMSFAALQRRIGRKTLSRNILSQFPVILMAFDLLEIDGGDCRHLPLFQRHERLSAEISRLQDDAIRLSTRVKADCWETLCEIKARARQKSVEGLMLKRLQSVYQSGRRRGDWWKWKVDPLSADAVLIYAQRGHGRRSGLFTDYTFAVWDQNELVPFAKAYSGLTDGEIRDVDRFIRQNTLERFGPVRSVRPELVFEIAFEAIQESPRHKSGIAVRFPRITRWRKDKTARDADTIDAVRGLMYSGPPTTLRTAGSTHENT